MTELARCLKDIAFLPVSDLMGGFRLFFRFTHTKSAYLGSISKFSAVFSWPIQALSSLNTYQEL
ncbi:hypothetical protein, partial [Holospora curviuscula]|uniref:hypothetical protein n=1 Tax=Holospora curviuscula TaxID=1082868 RepID=UPI001A9C2CDB